MSPTTMTRRQLSKWPIFWLLGLGISFLDFNNIEHLPMPFEASLVVPDVIPELLLLQDHNVWATGFKEVQVYLHVDEYIFDVACSIN